MFKDYYYILDIDENVSQEDIKLAFKKQALKWHPDRNLGEDTTIKMQEINEAYLILKDIEARERYNKEYQIFRQYQKAKINEEQEKHESTSNKKERTYEYSDYQVKDDTLYNWMNNAKQQAVDLAKQTIDDFRGMAILGVKEAAKGAGQQFIMQIIVGIIFMVIFALVKSCQ